MNATPDQFSPNDMLTPGMEYIPPQNPYDLRVGFGKRLGAYAIDFLITLGITFVLKAALGIDAVEAEIEANMQEGIMSLSEGISAMVSASTIPYAASVLYFLLELFTGASLGKHILKIVIAHPERTAGDFNIFALRWAIKYSPSLAFLLSALTGNLIIAGIGLLLTIIFIIGCFVALGEKKQALHDIIAKTAIYNKGDVIAANGME